MVQADALLFLQNNPLILWGGIVLSAIIFLIARHMDKDESAREAPEPTTLDKIVKPKVKEHLSNRGRKPGSPTAFKIGRTHKGMVHRWVETELPDELINPNPHQESDTGDGKEKVRILSVKPSRRIERIIEAIIAMFTRREPTRKLYVFRVESFMDTPNQNEMIVDDDVMSYTFGGMEVELSDSSKNTVNQAVETAVSEKLLSALPNYTEKVDYLFPLHSQKISQLKEENRMEEEW